MDSIPLHHLGSPPTHTHTHTHTHTQLNHLSEHLKLTQLCKSAILQFHVNNERSQSEKVTYCTIPSALHVRKDKAIQKIRSMNGSKDLRKRGVNR